MVGWCLHNIILLVYVEPIWSNTHTHVHLLHFCMLIWKSKRSPRCTQWANCTWTKLLLGHHVGQKWLAFGQQPLKSHVASMGQHDQPVVAPNMFVSWNKGTPSYHPFLDGIFPETNQLSGDPPWIRNIWHQKMLFRQGHPLQAAAKDVPAVARVWHPSNSLRWCDIWVDRVSTQGFLLTIIDSYDHQDYHGYDLIEVESISGMFVLFFCYPVIFNLSFCNAKTTWPSLSHTFSEARHFVWWHCGASQATPALRWGVWSDIMGSTDQEHPPRNGQPDNIIHILSYTIYINTHVHIYIYTHKYVMMMYVHTHW